ncbi:MAG: lipoyl(octanoyl) transferase LipB [Acidobacteria bacterium]|nr:lipoyl(octanoyl) transferase LipB [Acidobacteriota bacterium]
MRSLEVHDLGRMSWAQAYERQHALVGQRQRDEIVDQLLLVEHPHVVTLGRNAKEENILVPAALLASKGIDLEETNRGGDVTYHGPGQIVGYPILQLNDWKRDVHAYVRAIEEVIIRAIGEFGVEGERSTLNSGVWVKGAEGLAKICAIGVHISRWVSSHGFALNHSTDLRYFGYIVPCGLQAPVTSLEQHFPGRLLPSRAQVIEAIVHHFGRIFEFNDPAAFSFAGDPALLETAP